MMMMIKPTASVVGIFFLGVLFHSSSPQVVHFKQKKLKKRKKKYEAPLLHYAPWQRNITEDSSPVFFLFFVMNVAHNVFPPSPILSPLIEVHLLLSNKRNPTPLILNYDYSLLRLPTDLKPLNLKFLYGRCLKSCFFPVCCCRLWMARYITVLILVSLMCSFVMIVDVAPVNGAAVVVQAQ